MKYLLSTIFLAGILAGAGCRPKPETSPDEIPAIKATLAALERVIADRNEVYVDTLLSREAGDAGTSSRTLLAFIYAAGVEKFAGFGDKRIVFRGDAARVDCTLLGAGGPVRPVVLTLKKEDGVWLFKKIEPGMAGEPELPDSMRVPQDSAG
jgi:hypothetical protein